MLDATSSDNLDLILTPNDQVDPDYMEYLQTLAQEDLPRTQPSSGIELFPSSDPSALNFNDVPLENITENLPPSLDINIEANPINPTPEPPLDNDVNLLPIIASPHHPCPIPTDRRC